MYIITFLNNSIYKVDEVRDGPRGLVWWYSLNC